MDGTPATILLVEDHPATRTFLADNLSADGYELLEADCALDGERLIESGFPDLAIIDLGLPDGDGLELLRRVRQADRVAGRIDPDLPLLILSGRTTELDRLRGFSRGCDDYVIKPFSYQELRGLLSSTARNGRSGTFKYGGSTGGSLRACWRWRPRCASRPAGRVLIRC
jgi:DNA-binding response OmpR family regulator